MAALITQAQWETVLGAARVVDLCDDDDDGTADAAVVTEVLEQASDFVQEFAVAAGATLTAGSLTAAMRRRVAMVAAHYAGARRQEFRDAQGKAPYAVEYETAERELKAWAARTRDLSTGDVSTAPEVLSEESAGW